MSNVWVLDVALDPRNGGSDAVWTYLADDTTAIGDAVFVPLGTRSVMGFVVARYETDEAGLGFPIKALKPVQMRIDGLAIPPQLVQLGKFVSQQYLCPLPVALSASTPPGVRDRLVTSWSLRAARVLDLTPTQQEVVRVLQEKGGAIDEGKGKNIEASILRTLKRLAALGVVERTMTIHQPQERRKSEGLLRLCADQAKVDQFLAHEGRRKPAQALTLMRIQSAEQGALTAHEIRALAGVTESTVRALVQAGFLERADADGHLQTKAPPTPNDAQSIAIDAITESVKTHESRNFLLFGVTGSGKTEVFLRSAAEALRQGRQVLYIVPEIALAAQAIAQLRDRFGNTVAVLHSDLAATERLNNWLRIRDGDASVVLGARSAMFAPLNNIGLIIVDEEHEQSYKQDSAPRYHAKRVALELGKLHKCPVVLGSATPSLESFHQAENHELTLLSLPARAASAKLPTIEVHNLSDGYKAGKPAIISDRLRELMEQALERGEQAILFLNRRAYAPFLMCRDCGHHMGCPHCSVSLSFHRRDKKLKCHYCDYQITPPDCCPKCAGLRISPFGVGTEKVEEAMAAEFPNYKVARLDRDVAKKKGALEETLAGFRANEIQILVGTQMVAKGLDFPNVTVVGVIAADISLNLPDFRSSERTFQLLSQVAGRAGRGAAHGTVVIQTFNPEHPSVTFAQAHDYLAFFDAVCKEREEAGYPPFRRLVNIVLSGEDLNTVIKAADEVARLLNRHISPKDTQLLGPVDCPVERVLGKWRQHILLKLPPTSSVEAVGIALQGYSPNNVQIVVDVDPMSLM